MIPGRFFLASALLVAVAAIVPRSEASVEADGGPPAPFSPLFERRLEVGMENLDRPAGSILIAHLDTLESASVDSPLSANPVSGCLGSACSLSICLGSACLNSRCLGSGCLLSACLGSSCVTSGCGGSACVASTCGGSACVGSVCGGSACVKSGCYGSACVECSRERNLRRP